MIKLLFVINSLTIGGSEKSLVSLLDLIDYSKYEVDLFMLKKGEAFDKYIPAEVNVLDIPDYYRYINNENIKKSNIIKIKYSICRYKSSLELRLNGKIKKLLNNQQIFYKNQRNVLDNLTKKYDVAIAYAQGFPTYFVADKVNAIKKLAWINCDYKTTSYDKNMDKIFYDKIDKIIAVSKVCKDSIIAVNKIYEEKIEVIMDIVNPELIEMMSNSNVEEFDSNKINILTVARLVVHHKGYDVAVMAAKILKDKKIGFKWYVVGEGSDRHEIEKLIEKNNLEENFILLGSRDNPYPYMKSCDIYVQPSRYEGFGLTVIEAKVLKKTIVCSNFNTVKELINNEVDGLVVGMKSDNLAVGIMRVISDIEFQNRIKYNLNNSEKYNSMSEIEKIYKLIES
ncbi:MAG: glycosyltransferase [Romboutsia sp.]